MPAPVMLSLIAAIEMFASSRRPERLDASRAAMEAVVGGTCSEADIQRLARRHAVAQAQGEELAWRPWLLRRLPIRGAGHLTEAVASGRGVIVSFVHLGPLVGRAVLGRLLPTAHLPVAEYLFQNNPPGYDGYRAERIRRILRASDYRILPAKGSGRALREVLGSAGIVMVAMDVPGPTPTDFLGKSVELANGTSKLASATNSLVVPISVRPRGRFGWEVTVETVLDPQDFPSWAELHQALADVHDGVVTRHPEHLESPLRDGGWARADRFGWCVSR
ncbi:hypothetical protein JKP75_00710 [Blastococcus sp. TML/M2B]|uniref:hypothetical protein n=1 Tax=unclassified Blastococcus TaxID=2619396 RepID=UPI00190A815C|nr:MULTISPECIES: hypothetical protein [unclassified Blastococcus]MBN1091244.1 hypothetical protein [Blastococcus sp. TML/M2B]MBN1095200.1 hypothetical protein [Blastococcus sp. TML/C7B]